MFLIYRILEKKNVIKTLLYETYNELELSVEKKKHSLLSLKYLR